MSGRKIIRIPCIVDAAAVVTKPVAHHQVIHLQHHVVTGNLVKDSLRNLHRRSLVFHNHLRSQVAPVEHRITAFLRSVQVDLYLIGQQSLRIPLFLQQEIRKNAGVPTPPESALHTGGEARQISRSFPLAGQSWPQKQAGSMQT